MRSPRTSPEVKVGDSWAGVPRDSDDDVCAEGLMVVSLGCATGNLENTGIVLFHRHVSRETFLLKHKYTSALVSIRQGVAVFGFEHKV